MRCRVVPVFAVILFAAVARAAVSAECVAPPDSPAPEAGQPPNLGLLKQQLTFYKCSGAYDRDVAAKVAEALTYIEERAALVKNPALVLDIDETALSNWRQIAADDFGFIERGSCTLAPREPCGFNEWVAYQTAEAIAPTLALFNAARAKGVAVFFISGRHEDQRFATANNLTAVGYQGWSALLLRPVGDTSSARDFKTAQRKQIVSDGFAVIANVGDQMSDLEGGYAERTFKLPNPFYMIQ